MKKILTTIIFIFTIFNLTGCYQSDELEGSKITTTVYPIEYLVSRLYGYNSKITSIYPNDTDVYEYKLTDKQITDYSKTTNLFVYNGLTNEKEIARTLINKNKKIQILDVSYGLKYSYGVEELWLSPNNYLMLANTIKKDLEELSSSKYAVETIEENYKSLEEDLSILDAKIKSIADSAKEQNRHTIIIGDNTFGFLETYGFKTISVAEEKNITSTIKTRFKSKTYTHIFVKNSKNVPDHIKDLVDNYGAILVEIKAMNTLTDKERQNNDTYLTIMNEFINDLSNTVLSK